VLAFFHRKTQFALVGYFIAKGSGVAFPSQEQLLLILLMLSVLVITLTELFRNKSSATFNVASTMMGILYIPLLLGSLVGLRELFTPFDIPVLRYFPQATSAYDPVLANVLNSWGGATVVSVFVSIWLCDTAAYQAGMMLGKHKLFPRVSPAKSWEGAVAGFIAGVGTMLLARMWFLPFLSIVDSLVLGIITGGAGQLGDLVESLFKRDAGVKDSSGLLPGHGGVLDRFDSLLFASPLVYLYIDFVVFS
jgi:phosphatidate cytidylyltransferase